MESIKSGAIKLNYRKILKHLYRGIHKINYLKLKKKINNKESKCKFKINRKEEYQKLKKKENRRFAYLEEEYFHKGLLERMITSKKEQLYLLNRFKELLLNKYGILWKKKYNEMLLKEYIFFELDGDHYNIPNRSIYGVLLKETIIEDRNALM